MSLLSRRIEVFDFYRGVSHWRYTSTDRPVILASQEYANIKGFKRGRIASSAEAARNALELTVPLSLPLLQIFQPFPPTERIHLNHKRIRVSDGVVSTAWMGVVAGVEYGQHTATLRCQTLLAAMGGNGLRRCWQVPCPHVLYGVGTGLCNVNQDDFRLDTTLSGATPLVLESSDFALHGDDYYRGGFVRWNVGTDVEHRFIVSQVGIQLTLLTPCALPVGAAVSVFPGCDHTLATCDTKFGNAPNYGGQHTIPKRNPLDGSPVF